MISTLNGWSRSTRNARRLGRRQLASARTDGRRRCSRASAPRSPARSSGVSGRGSSEVVVEAVVDGRADPELRAREQVQDRLGHDVGGRVAHRAELAAARRHPAARRPSRARAPRADLVASSSRAALSCSSLIVRPPENHETPRPSTGREVHSRGPTRLRAADAARALVVALTGDARAGSPAAHGWCSIAGRPPGFQPWPGSLGIDAPRRRVPIDACFVMWWATLDSNQ